MNAESRTRICMECHAPMVLGKRECQECGSPEWVWRHPGSGNVAPDYQHREDTVSDQRNRGSSAGNLQAPPSHRLSVDERRNSMSRFTFRPVGREECMSEIRKRLIDLLKQHTWYAVGNLGVPGMPDQLSYKCYCGWEGDDPHGHVADSITSSIELHEDRYRSAFAADDCDYDKVRYSTPWLDLT